jgi:ankyrin repeat protein
VKAFVESKVEKFPDEFNYGCALLNAAKWNKIEIVQALINANADTTWYWGATQQNVLHFAVINNNPDMVRLLVNAGVNCGKKNAGGQTPIQLAAEKEYWSCVIAFVETKSEAWLDQFNYGAALVQAARCNQTSVVEALLNARTSTTWHHIDTKRRSLHHAVINNNSTMYRALCNAGAKQSYDNDDKTSLMLAIEKGYWECVKIHIEFSPDRDKKIYRVAYDNILSIVKLLLSLEKRKARLAEKNRENLLEHKLITNLISELINFINRLKINPDKTVSNNNTDFQKASLIRQINYLAKITPTRKGIFSSPLFSDIHRAQKALVDYVHVSNNLVNASFGTDKLLTLSEKLQQEIKKYLKDDMGMFLYGSVGSVLESMQFTTDQSGLIDELKTLQEKIPGAMLYLDNKKDSDCVTVLNKITEEISNVIANINPSVSPGVS